MEKRGKKVEKTKNRIEEEVECEEKNVEKQVHYAQSRMWKIVEKIENNG